MKLRHAWDDVLSSRIKIEVLRAFFHHPGKEFTEREMARYLNRKPSSVSYALKDLASLGVLQMKGIGRANVYALNRDNYFAETALFPLFEAEAKVPEELSNRIRANLQEADAVLLFGSVARGEEAPSSDIDLLIVTDYKKEAENILPSLQDYAAKTFGLPLQGYVLNKGELAEKKNQGFIPHALQEGILISGVRP